MYLKQEHYQEDPIKIGLHYIVDSICEIDFWEDRWCLRIGKASYI